MTWLQKHTRNRERRKVTMKTINKLLWAFTSFFICIIYKSDVQATYVIQTKTLSTSGCGDHPIKCRAPATQTITQNKGTKNQYFISCQSGITDYSHCYNSATFGDCPNGGTLGRYPLKLRSAIYGLSGCCHHLPGSNECFDTQCRSYVFTYNINSEIGIGGNIKSCYQPASTIFSDTRGKYKYTTSCYYN